MTAIRDAEGTECAVTTFRCEPMPSELVLNAIAEVEAGLPPTDAEAIKEYVVVPTRLFHQDELLLEDPQRQSCAELFRWAGPRRPRGSASVP